MIVRAVHEQRATLAKPDQWLVSAFTGTQAKSSVSVTAESALTNTAVLAAVQRLARAVAVLPFILYRVGEGESKTRDRQHPLYPILHDQANEEMTALEYREFQMGNLLLRGNAYAYIDTDGAGRIRGLWPLRADRVSLERKAGMLRYEWRPLTARPRIFFSGEIHHIRGLSLDGVSGLSPIALAREAVGLGLAAEEFGARFFANDATPSYALKHPGELSTPAHDRLIRSMEEKHKGLSKSHKLAVLEEGMDIAKIGVDPKDSQFLETRKFQVREAARFFGVQPHLVGDLENATFTNIESQGIEFVVYTLGYWLKAFEQATRRDLLLPRERETHFAEFLVEQLLRGDSQARGEFYMRLFQMGAISPNEIRLRENLNPYPGGDERYVQLNMVPVSQAGTLPAVRGDRPAPSETRSAERRAAVDSRRRLRSAFERLFRLQLVRVFRAERREVMREARIQLPRRSRETFDLWLGDFYRNHQDFVRQSMLPVYFTYAEAVEPIAADEASRGSVLADGGDRSELDAYVSEMATAHAARHVGSSRAQLEELLRTTTEDPVEALNAKFAEWEEQRSERIARRESVQAGEGIAKFVFAAAGLRLVWRAFGESCPFCTGMDGRVVSAGDTFAREGEELQAPDRAPLLTRTAITTPPLHGGCDCSVVPG